MLGGVWLGVKPGLEKASGVRILILLGPGTQPQGGGDRPEARVGWLGLLLRNRGSLWWWAGMVSS